jgi:hypothetical protein
MGTPYPRYHQLPSPPAVVSSTAAGVQWRSSISQFNGRWAGEPPRPPRPPASPVHLLLSPALLMLLACCCC